MITLLLIFLLACFSALAASKNLFINPFSLSAREQQQRELAATVQCDYFGSPDQNVSCSRVSLDLSMLGQQKLYIPQSAASTKATTSLLFSSASDQLPPVSMDRIPSYANDHAYSIADTSKIAVFVQTKHGITGNIPSIDSHGFIHISPCFGGDDGDGGNIVSDCHVLTRVERNRQEEPGTDAVQPPNNKILQSSEDTSGIGDYMCANGVLSEDHLYCCKTGPCTESSHAFTNSCRFSPAPCYMLAVQTVYVGYTPQALLTTRDMEGVIKLSVAETNQGYINSKIPIRLELKGFALRTDIADISDSLTMLMQFRATANMGADMAVLLSESISSCGRGYMDCAIYGPMACAYAVVKISCATGYYSFGHELGHIQGADHNKEAASGATRFTDNFGLVITPGYTNTGGLRTIMAYSIYDETRLLQFSNPLISVNGKATGYLGSSNNARVLTYTRYAISSLGTEGEPITSTGKPTTKQPSPFPTRAPSKLPTVKSTGVPTNLPSVKPTRMPTAAEQTPKPTSQSPTMSNTQAPTSPSPPPTKRPTSNPTPLPTKKPTLKPTSKPTKQPVTVRPTAQPTTKQPVSVRPTSQPTTKQPVSVRPTSQPTTKQPASVRPTSQPTTKQPASVRPTTNIPVSTNTPSAVDTEPTLAPTARVFTRYPTKADPLLEEVIPSQIPTVQPVRIFSRFPTQVQPRFQVTDEENKHVDQDKLEEGGSSSSTALIAGVSAGLIALAVVAGFAIVRRRRRNSASPTDTQQERMVVFATALLPHPKPKSSSSSVEVDEESFPQQKRSPLKVRIRNRLNSLATLANASPPRKAFSTRGMSTTASRRLFAAGSQEDIIVAAEHTTEDM